MQDVQQLRGHKDKKQVAKEAKEWRQKTLQDNARHKQQEQQQQQQGPGNKREYNSNSSRGARSQEVGAVRSGARQQKISAAMAWACVWLLAASQLGLITSAHARSGCSRGPGNKRWKGVSGSKRSQWARKQEKQQQRIASQQA
eukprot:scaffold177970_cov24-Tisochrysis_lutea.AAC.1